MSTESKRIERRDEIRVRGEIYFRLSWAQANWFLFNQSWQNRMKFFISKFWLSVNRALEKFVMKIIFFFICSLYWWKFSEQFDDAFRWWNISNNIFSNNWRRFQSSNINDRRLSMQSSDLVSQICLTNTGENLESSKGSQSLCRMFAQKRNLMKD